MSQSIEKDLMLLRKQHTPEKTYRGVPLMEALRCHKDPFEAWPCAVIRLLEAYERIAPKQEKMI